MQYQEQQRPLSLAPGPTGSFSPVREVELPYLKGSATEYLHPSGAMVIAIKNNDRYRHMAVSFLTEPQGDSGLPHILEHLATRQWNSMAGSTDALFGLTSATSNQILNAHTDRGITAYYAGSAQPKDFALLQRYLLDIGLDTQLNRDDFAQEIHRWRRGSDGRWRRSGTLLNEMRSDSPEERIAHAVTKAFFEGTPWAYNFGGEPAAIELVTFDDVVAYHQQWYRPERCRIALYGDIDVEASLQQISEKITRLSGHTDNNPGDSYLRSVTRTPHRSLIDIHVPLSTRGDDGIVAIGHALGSGERESFAFEELIAPYARSPFHTRSFLSQALQRSLGQSCQVYLGDNTPLGIGIVALRTGKISAADRITALWRDTLAEMAASGLPPSFVARRLAAAGREEREIAAGLNIGELMIEQILNDWGSRRDPLPSPTPGASREFLLKDARAGQPWLKSYLREYLLPTDSTVVVRAHAVTDEHEREHQRRSSPEALPPSTVISLSEELISVRVYEPHEVIGADLDEVQDPVADPPTVSLSVKKNIFYRPASRLSDAADLTVTSALWRLPGDPQIIPWSGLLADIVPYLAENRLAGERASHPPASSGADFSAYLFGVTSPTGEVEALLESKVSGLSTFADRYAPFAASIFRRECRLPTEVVGVTIHDTLDDLEGQIRDGINNGSYAERRAGALIDPTDALYDRICGIGSLTFLRTLRDRFNDRNQQPLVMKRLHEALRTLQRPPDFLSITAPPSIVREIAVGATSVVSPTPQHPSLLTDRGRGGIEIWTAPGEVGTVAIALSLRSLGRERFPVAEVASVWLTEYLSKVLRNRNNSYGVQVSFDPASALLTMHATALLDIEPALEVLKSSADELARQQLTPLHCRHLAKSLLAEMDSADSLDDLHDRGALVKLRSPEMTNQGHRYARIRAVTPEEVRTVGQHMRSAMRSASSVVIAPPELVRSLSARTGVLPRRLV